MMMMMTGGGGACRAHIGGGHQVITESLETFVERLMPLHELLAVELSLQLDVTTRQCGRCRRRRCRRGRERRIEARDAPQRDELVHQVRARLMYGQRQIVVVVVARVT